MDENPNKAPVSSSSAKSSWMAIFQSLARVLLAVVAIAIAATMTWMGYVLYAMSHFRPE
jgi:hypothetical protein